MVLRRGRITEIHAISVIPRFLNTITQGRGGGGFTLKKKSKPSKSQATCFSNPHTNLGPRRSKAPWSYFCHKLGNVIS